MLFRSCSVAAVGWRGIVIDVASIAQRIVNRAVLAFNCRQNDDTAPNLIFPYLKVLLFLLHSAPLLADLERLRDGSFTGWTAGSGH